MPINDNSRCRKVYPVGRAKAGPRDLVTGPAGPKGETGDPGTFSTAGLIVGYGKFRNTGGGTSYVVTDANIVQGFTVVFCLGIQNNQGAAPYVTSITNNTSFTVSHTAGDSSTYYYVILGHPIF